MATLIWDGSSLSKRYVSEPGTDTVNHLFSLQPPLLSIFTFPGYAEVYSILRRCRNNGRLTPELHEAARSLLRMEVLDGEDFAFLDMDDDAFIASLPLIDRHNLNATDAAILAAFLDYRASLPPEELPVILVASDHRLLRAARAEGLATLDPEAVRPEDVSAALGGV